MQLPRGRIDSVDDPIPLPARAGRPRPPLRPHHPAPRARLAGQAAGAARLGARIDPGRHRHRPRFQYYWWTRLGAGGRTDFWGQGNHGQFVDVAPDRDVMLVRFGTDDNDDHWTELLAELARRL